MNAMHRTEHAGGIVTYTFEQLAGYPVIAHVTARHGGVSPEPWKSLNFSTARGDSQEHVRKNRRLLGEVLGPVTDFPKHLPLPDQGRFALGYYHQRQDFFTKKPDDSTAHTTPSTQGTPA